MLFAQTQQARLSASQDIQVDLKALDSDQFRITLGAQTLAAQAVQRSVVNGSTVVESTFAGGGDLLVARDGATLTGVLRVGAMGYEIQPTPGGGHRLIPRSLERPRPIHGPLWDRISAERGAPAPLRRTTGTTEISVLFAYTDEVEKKRTLAGINGHIAVAMMQLRRAGRAGKVNARFVAIKPPTRTIGKEDGRSVEEIYYLALKRDGEFKDAHAARKEARADILVLLVDRVEGGLGAATIMAEPDTAVAVADHNDSLYGLTIPHEIGHIMGGIHDDDTSDYPYPYGHGYVGAEGRTIMSNRCHGQDDCILLQQWSSASGHGDEDKYDVARVVRENAATVATFGDNL